MTKFLRQQERRRVSFFSFFFFLFWKISFLIFFSLRPQQSVSGLIFFSYLLFGTRYCGPWPTFYKTQPPEIFHACLEDTITDSIPSRIPGVRLDPGQSLPLR
ncbi:hypothetical protein GYMLUDRAFT_955038 [Collybiopsis luxurians FD-317 M1]|nr:hypothetical protein GYMLUDRAFT_955038 [Collybiopsis luxurians FD-317 M1]